MATVTKASDIPILEQQVSGLKEKAKVYEDKLISSPTASGSGDPSSTDVYNQRTFQNLNTQIQGINDNILRAKWYPPKSQAVTATQAGETEAKTGIIGKGLDWLTRPLYGIVGATKSLIGQGTGSLQQDIADNILRNKNTFGDVLKTSGVNSMIASPLGFALDIAMDPVNWATMGGGALVPRLGIGAIQGVKTGEGLVKGLSTAAKSGVLEKAVTVGKYIPGVKGTEAFAKLGKEAIAATDVYEALTRTTAADIAAKRGIGAGAYRMGLGTIATKVAESVPGGEKFLEHWVYDPVEWVKQARVKDIFQRKLGPGVDLSKAVDAYETGNLAELSQQVAKKIESTPVSQGELLFGDTKDLKLYTPAETDVAINKINSISEGSGLVSKIENAADDITKQINDVSIINENPKAITSLDPHRNAELLMEDALAETNKKIGGNTITMEEVAKIVKSGGLDQTGVKWFDNMMNGIRDFASKVDTNGDKIPGIGKKTMDWYERAMAIFKVSKVAASPTSWMNAVVGNLAMTHMAGGSINPQFLTRLKQSWGLLGNKPGMQAKFDGMLAVAGKGEGDFLRRFMAENPTAIRGTLGPVGFVGDAATGRKGASEYVAEELLGHGNDLGITNSSIKAKDIAPEVEAVLGEIATVYDRELAAAVSKKALRTKEMMDPSMSTATMVKKLLKEDPDAFKNLSKLDIATGMTSQELLNSKVTVQMFQYIADKAAANPNNLAWKLFDATFNKLPEGYEKIDQSFKWATFITATVDGYSMNEFRRISKLIDINPEEIRTLIVDGQKRYALSPRSALELGNVMYLNYAAMPSAVRVLRSLPIFGSPFVSFMYGMTLKTGQTLAYNPAAFNKVTFGMNEFGGTKTPLEKKAIDDPNGYYSYLKDLGMYRLPTKLFDENPLYLNLANMIPYYSLNMFNPSKSQYGSSVREQLVQAVQNSPILKDPVGSTIFDNIIQPLILGEAIQPQGQFGQPLYPVDATLLEKTGYAARGFGEAFVPNIYNYAGLLTPEAAADYVPSYRWRQLSKAKAGKNQLGISSKEPTSSRLIRTVLQASGVPLQAPVNTTFVK